MKIVVTTLVSLASATSLLAHGVAAPHTHEGASVNWTPAVACVAAVALAIFMAAKLAKRKQKSASRH